MFSGVSTHREAVERLGRAILETAGATSTHERAAAMAGQPTASAADEYLQKVRRESYRIADADLNQVLAAGLSEDEVFELSLAAAFGEARRRFDDAMAAVDRTEPRTG